MVEAEASEEEEGDFPPFAPVAVEKAAALPQLTGRKQADIEPIEQDAL